MANLPPVKLETHATWFNLLLTLCRQYDPDQDYSAELKNTEKE